MPLKNYTTKVSAMKSVGEIQGNLVAHGARSIMVDYDKNKSPIGLSFIISIPEGDISFRLPAHVQQVEKILLDMRSRRLETWRYDYDRAMAKLREQAANVAWRIIKDWVAAQVAIIETEMVTMTEVFLPYMRVGEGKQTLFEVMEGRKFLTDGKGE